MWTVPQEIFDRVSSHLLKQKRQCLADNRCVYRNDEGRSCAVGCLFDDSFYTSRYEGSSVRELPPEAITYLGGEVMLSLLDDLQQVHDMCNVGSWRDRLRQVAAKHGLKASPSPDVHT